jgi:hypothetical protein
VLVATVVVRRRVTARRAVVADVGVGAAAAVAKAVRKGRRVRTWAGNANHVRRGQRPKGNRRRVKP